MRGERRVSTRRFLAGRVEGVIERGFTGAMTGPARRDGPGPPAESSVADLRRLVGECRITLDTARSFASDPEEFGAGGR